ncbi:hypothetical protein R3P38DRAFT_2604095 [Favolaschia claudopus]|uniref:Uncharacterized protein n=1 Tax=Favolaschia claudopus TaxID=2862362 RepID=A0AAW0DQG8_9AGAR
MHRALGILEMVELICENSTKRTGFPDDASLAVLARTCKFFTNPALNVLWKSQYTILNVLKCMPDELWEITSPAAVSLRRSLVASDWDRPLFYLNRVKCFQCMALFSDTSFLAALAASLHSLSMKHLFPKLEELWWPVEALFVRHIDLFLTAELRHLLMFAHNEDNVDLDPLLPVVAGFPSSCPLLRSLEITLDNPGHTTPLTSSLSACVRGLKYIDSIHVPSLDESALLYLAELTSLKTLTIKFIPPLRSSSWAQIKSCYPSLTQLTLGTPDETAELLSLSQWKAHPLGSLCVRSVGTDFTHNAAHNFFTILKTHCSHSSLQSITIGSQYNQPVQDIQDPAFIVGPDVFRRMSCFTDLRYLSITSSRGFDLDDMSVAEIARTWPRLQTLALSAAPHYHVPSRVTLEGISALAKHCTDLRMLSMTFDATVVPTPDTVPQGQDGADIASPRHSLRILQVNQTPILDAQAVADFLAPVFPELAVIWTTQMMTASQEDALSPDEERWRTVLKKMKPEVVRRP